MTKEDYLEEVEELLNTYYICYFEPYYIKMIGEDITFPNVKGMGHILSYRISMDENGELSFSITPHNEAKSSSLGERYTFEELLVNQELRDLFYRLEEKIDSLIKESKFKNQMLINVFEEFKENLDQKSINRPVKFLLKCHLNHY